MPETIVWPDLAYEARALGADALLGTPIALAGALLTGLFFTRRSPLASYVGDVIHSAT